jgi:hypothetical protein
MIMKNIVTILSVMIFTTFYILSFGQSNTKQNDLVLNEKEISKTDFDKDDFLGCWYWGEEKEGFAILNVKPNGILIIHRIDLDMDFEAGYKFVDNKIVFTNNTLLMQNKYHLESIDNKILLVEECPENPGITLKKIDCSTDKNDPMTFSDKVCGLWKAKGKLNKYSGRIDMNFLKIVNCGNGKICFKKGSYSLASNGHDTNSEKDIYWETDADIITNISNDKIEGKFRVWQGSAPDAYYDTSFSIVLKDENIVLYMSNIKDGAGNVSNESFEASRINK